MNSAKRVFLLMAIGTLSVVMVGLVGGNLEKASAAPPVSNMDVTVTNGSSNAVPVVPQGTTNVSGTVNVGNWPTSAMPVVPQGTVTVAGRVGLTADANTVKIDPSNNTVKLADGAVKLDPNVPMTVSGTVGLSSGATVGLSPNANTVKLDSNAVRLDPAGNTVSLASGGNTVKLDPSGNTVRLDAAGSMTVSGAVGLDPAGNTVKLDPAASTVGLSSNANTVKLDPSGNTVKIDAAGPMTVGGTVGLSGSANTVKIDSSNNTVKIDATSSIPLSGTVGLSSEANTIKLDYAYTNDHPVKVWGWTALDPNANNRVQTANPIDPETKLAVPLLVKVVGGGAGGSAQQPVQFKHVHNQTGFSGAYVVPAGKILKIEHVSVFAEVSANYPQANVETTMGGVTMQHVLPRLELEEQSGPNWSVDMYRVSAPVTYYADEGTTVRSMVRAALGVGLGSGAVELMFSGYLTDK